MLKHLKTFNPAEIEEKVLAFWQKNQIFEKSLKQRQSAKNKTFKFYEGPPYANGRPGLHHIIARVFKDIILRYKAMQGYYVPRKAGWDTHGLPVEIEAEKQLGIKSKKEIEKFGIALFNEKAKDAVWKYKDEWEKLTERIGYWLDLKNAYITYENSYIESCWWIFKRIAERGFLKKSYKVIPFCTRCGTPLSSHELAMPGAYQTAKDVSVFVKFKVKAKSKDWENTSILAWTTTPWTLPGNVALAIDPKATYVCVPDPDSKGYWLVLAKDLFLKFIEKGFFPPEYKQLKEPNIDELKGGELIGIEYEPLFKIKVLQTEKSYQVYAADFVTMEDGTGVVHTAVMYGEDDFDLGKKIGLPMHHTVDETGRFTKEVGGGFEGKYVKDPETEKLIIKTLRKNGNFFREEKYEHEYPFCWRCGTSLLYYARESWFFEVSKLRKELVEANQKINWIPGHIKDGRFGEWIKEAKDWAISRDRYWGTPLPIWECEKCNEIFVAGSLGDLNERAYSKNNFFLVRHGEGTANVADIIASGPEKGGHISKLTSRGIKQSENVAKILSRKKIDVIYSSPYKRTVDTAEIVAKKTSAKVIFDKRLGELDCGTYNWRSIKDFRGLFQNTAERFVKTPPGGENLNDLRKRVSDFMLEVNEKYIGKNIVIVSHGNPIWMMETVAAGIGIEASLKMPQFVNGQVKAIRYLNIPRKPDGETDIHRPFIDHVFLRCACGHKMTRVRDVADVWFDSGAVPLASYHYPFSGSQKSKVNGQRLPDTYPADYISEAIDQTRGWFYTMLAIAVLLGNDAPYKNVICLGLILDKNGVKMSKSKGNIVDPWEIMSKYGVDAVRWYFYTVNPPGEPKLFHESEVGKTMRRIFLILYNSYVFFETYGQKSKNAKQFKASPSSPNILDRWIIARRDKVVETTSKFLDAYDVGGAAKEIESLLDDLSRWYIRRSRRRFQKPSSNKDLRDASKTLEYILFDMSRLLAPFTPFFAEALYQSLRGHYADTTRTSADGQRMSASSQRKSASLSVHLEDWPGVSGTTGKKTDSSLINQMAWVREVATLALAKRAEAGIKVRQPLQSVTCHVSSIKLNKELLEILKDEINVKKILFFTKGESPPSPDFGRAGASGGDEKLGNETVLDTKITPKLKEEGMMRDLVRAVQELRQNAGYTPKDKIELFVSGGVFDTIITRHEKDLKKEIGAKIISLKKSEKFDAEIETKLDGQEIWLGVNKMRN